MKQPSVSKQRADLYTQMRTIVQGANYDEYHQRINEKVAPHVKASERVIRRSLAKAHLRIW